MARTQFPGGWQVAIQSNKKANESAETEFVATRDNALKAGIAGKDSWEKVTSYLDLQADPKRANTVLLGSRSRFRSPVILGNSGSWLHGRSPVHNDRASTQEQAGPEAPHTFQVSRMKSVLIAVKATPPATKPNFGAAA